MRITKTSANYLDEGGTRYLLEQIHDIIDEEISIQSGLPEGGNTGQVLAKASNDNFDVEWVNQSGGGGGGGSTVTITPTLATGTKIADYSIDGVSGELYAPNNGGSGGTTNYNDLSNKPTINNVTLIGNKSFSDLGLSTATTSTNGLMSSSDKAKLNGIEANANNYHLPSGGSSGQVLGWTSDGTGHWVNQSGGGGGSTVSYQQILQSGTEIGRITIDNNTTSLYAPSGGGGDMSNYYTKAETYSKTETDELIPWVEKEFEVPADGSEQMGVDGYSCWILRYDNINWNAEYQTHTLPELTNDYPYIKFYVENYLYMDSVKGENAKAQYNYSVPDENGNPHYLNFVDKMYKDMEDRMSYAGAIQASDGITTYSNIAGQNYINIPNPVALADMQFAQRKIAKYHNPDSQPNVYSTNKQSSGEIRENVNYIQFKCTRDLGVLTVHFALKNEWSFTQNPIGINMFTSVDNVFSLHEMRSDLYYRNHLYDQYFSYTVDTDRYSDFYFFYDGYYGTELTYDDFELTVTDENGNIVTFTESDRYYQIESLKDYKMYGYDFPAEGTLMTVTVDYPILDTRGEPTGRHGSVTESIPWFTPTRMLKIFYTEPMHYTHYGLYAPATFSSSKFVHSVTTPTIVTRTVPLDPEDYYDKDQIDDIVEDLIIELEPVQGTTFTPSVTSITGGYRLSWTNDGGKQNPQSVNILNGTNGTNGTNGVDGQDGADGFSPVATVTQTSSGATISITDKNGTTTANITNGVDGQNGTNGTNGTNGVDGVSPTVSVTTITGGHTVSITDATTTSTFNVMDGQNGTNGTNGQDGVTPVITATATVDANTGTPSCTVTKTGTDAAPSYAFAFTNLKGANGYTPVRGTDYWTASDIAAIQNYIDTELGVISNGSY